MSLENVEIVRRIYADWERGDFSSPAFLEPEIRVEWVDPIFTRRSQTTGLQELAQAMTEFLDAWERGSGTATAERIIDAGDRVVAVVVWRGRGKASGIDVEERQGSVWTISEGKATRMVNYADPADAFKAAGLRE